MKEQTVATAQFSIYKINTEEVKNVFDVEPADVQDEYVNQIIQILINSIIKLVRKRPFSTAYRVVHKGLSGVFFKTVHTPAWGDLAQEIIAGNEYAEKQPQLSKDILTNTNVSYVLFYPIRDAIYAVTGGYGSNYISKFTEKNYGLYLIPKVIRQDNPVVKAIQQNNLLGNQTATQKVNKKSTSISLERDMSSIFRELHIEADRSVAEELGIQFDEGEAKNKRINIINKDSLVIRRSISIPELKKLLNAIYDLEKLPSMFALNYMVSVRKKGIKNQTALEQLIDTLIQGEFERFVLTGDDYITFYTGADKYILKDENGTALMDQTSPITFSDVIQQMPKTKLTKSAFQVMLKKWTISTFDNSGNAILRDQTIYNSLQGFVEIGESKIPCYLFNGLWYVFDEKFSAILLEEFAGVFDEMSAKSSVLAKEFGLKHKAKNEDTYNSWLREKTTVVVSHTVQQDNIEVADAIFWDENCVYLMHNKDAFSGSGARDVVNQVLTSAEYLQHNLTIYDRSVFLGKYYDAIFRKYQKEGKELPISKDEFIDSIISKKEICYVIGYIEGYEKTSRSTYAKYLTVDATKKLAAKGYDCIVLNLSE